MHQREREQKNENEHYQDGERKREREREREKEKGKSREIKGSLQKNGKITIQTGVQTGREKTIRQIK